VIKKGQSRGIGVEINIKVKVVARVKVKVKVFDHRRNATIRGPRHFLRQWRSQECELGAPLPCPLPPPPFNGDPGYNPGIFLKLKVLVGEF